MQKTKLTFLLKSLDKQEFRRLGRFLNSPFYNYSRPPVLLYESLKRFHPKFDSLKFTKHYIWMKVFQDLPFDTNKFWQLISKLTQLVEQFLIVLELESHPRNQRELLLQALGRKNVDELFEQEFNKQLEEIEKEKVNSNAFIQNKHSLFQIVSKFHGILDTKKALEILEKTADPLDLNFINQKLALACNLKNVENFLNKTYSINFLDQISEMINNGYGTDFPQFKIYLKLIELSKNGKEKEYWNLKKAFFNSINFFSRKDKKFIFHQLLNFTILHGNKGKEKFKKENLDLYKIGLEFDLIVENNKISYKSFTNIASFGASLREFEWTESFIIEYSNYLSEDIKEEALRMANAYLAFFKGDFSKTINLLLNYSFSQTIEMLRAKGLLIRSYFELYNMDSSYSHLFRSYSLSLDRYLRRDQVESEKRVKLYLNFVRLLRRLFHLIHNKKTTKNNVQKLKQEALQNEIILKPWLLQRIEQIKGT